MSVLFLDTWCYSHRGASSSYADTLDSSSAFLEHTLLNLRLGITMLYDSVKAREARIQARPGNIPGGQPDGQRLLTLHGGIFQFFPEIDPQITALHPKDVSTC